jgi:hypothetical protein
MRRKLKDNRIGLVINSVVIQVSFTKNAERPHKSNINDARVSGMSKGATVVADEFVVACVGNALQRKSVELDECCAISKKSVESNFKTEFKN